MRTLATQDTYISNLRSNFATEVYRQAAYRSRGIVQVCNTNNITPIILQGLSDYQIYGTITQVEADSLIDYLVKINA